MLSWKLSVNAFVPKVVQFRARLVKFHIHVHHGVVDRGVVEAGGNLVEGLAPCLGHAEEGEDEEEEQQRGEDQEHVGSAQLLGAGG